MITIYSTETQKQTLFSFAGKVLDLESYLRGGPFRRKNQITRQSDSKVEKGPQLQRKRSYHRFAYVFGITYCRIKVTTGKKKAEN